MSGKELFASILGADAEKAKAAKEKRLTDKRALISKITKEKQHLQPFVYNPSLIKQDPFAAYKREL